MKITKFGHSCVLVETEDRVGLFDPGVWSSLNVEDLPKIDRLVITHEHADHMDIDTITSIIDKSPSLHIVANDSVSERLQTAGVSGVEFRGDETDCTRPFKAPHEELPLKRAPIPVNTGYHFKDVFTHPGDSHSFSETKEVLALPVIAPWGSTVRAVELALELKPKYVVPIHDWHYKEEAKTWLYDLLEKAFDGSEIEIICRNDGKTNEIKL